MENRKIAMERYELQQAEVTRKATRHFYFILVINILLSFITVFEPGAFKRGLITFAVSSVLSVLVFVGVRFSTKLWVVLAAVQLGFYFFNVGKYIDINYPMSWFFLMCARSVFCLYSCWAFLLSYDVQDVVREHAKKLSKK